MTELEPSENVIAEILRLIRSGRTRVDFKRYRCKWSPSVVQHPVTGEVFTRAGAFEFICELIEQKVEVKVVKLRLPPGANGYYWIVDGFKGCPQIYIKIHIGSGVIWGRSFHYSNVEYDDES